MSKHDTHFFNVFSVVLGLLVAFAILMFVLARYVGKHEQGVHFLRDPMLQESVAQRVAQPSRVAVAGQDNSALVIAPVTTAATAVVVSAPVDGEGVYKVACTACHGPGLAGAPKSGDRSQWTARLAKGTPTLYEHAIKGFTGTAGVMPAKGGRTDLSDELIREAVDYMLAAL